MKPNFLRLTLTPPIICLLAACAGSGGVRQISQQLADTAPQAKATATALKAAYSETVNTLETQVQANFEKQRAASIGEIDRLHARAQLEVEKAYREALAAMDQSRRATDAGIESTIKRKLEFLDQRVQKLDMSAALLRPADPNERVAPELARRIMEADARYLAAFAALKETTAEAWEKGRSNLNGAAKVASSELDKIYGEQLQKLEATASKAKDEIAKLEQTPVGSIAVPAAFDALIAYLDAVAQSGATLNAYHQSTGFGKGSFFNNFVTSLRTGLSTGLSGGADGVSTEDVKTAGTALLDAIRDNLTSALEDDVEEAEEALADAADNAGDQMGGAAAAGVQAVAVAAIEKANHLK